MSKIKEHWGWIQRASDISQILVALVIVIPILFWSIKQLVLEGLNATVPAWSLLSVAFAFIVGVSICRKRHLREGTNVLPSKDLLEEICFNYPSASPNPENHGWIVRTEPDGKEKPIFDLENDGWYDRVLKTMPRDRYYMDYSIHEANKEIRRINFILKKGNWTVYAKVSVISQKGKNSQEVWLCFNAGIGKPEPYPDEKGNVYEWVFKIPLTKVNDDWFSLSADLSRCVEETFGLKGWRYDGISLIRLRNELTIAKIELLKK